MLWQASMADMAASQSLPGKSGSCACARVGRLGLGAVPRSASTTLARVELLPVGSRLGEAGRSSSPDCTPQRSRTGEGAASPHFQEGSEGNASRHQGMSYETYCCCLVGPSDNVQTMNRTHTSFYHGSPKFPSKVGSNMKVSLAKADPARMLPQPHVHTTH